ncbi:DUF2493 domain-containing protein [Ahrensia marina]|jgi:hypothetical protein|uniref:YspA cpYpsA-related SLOG domain-containing protein n=1 Tax=Ahrensia marina TaxID=1514904 RepID=A0A0N0VL70_9HYPH|nr:DUF2493 domain-containing protein [Ahrensia marina]KPB00664.1 hypothetical protein SU32_12675 [Ahrensia marina]
MLHPDHTHQTSQTAAIMDHLAMHGAPPPADEPDHRHLPDDDQIDLAMVSLFGSLQELLSGSQLEDDLEEVLWSMTNIFHRRIAALSKRLDDTDVSMRELLSAQDGSEVKSVELERIQDRSATLTEQVSSFETMRDIAIQHFAAITGSVWLPRTGSRVSNRALTASVVDSKSYLMAKRRKETETLCPEGTRIAFAGGDFQDHNIVWATLDATKSKYPDMILLHGGAPKSAETIASKWADNRGVTQIVFKPDWKKDGRAAPFQRNDKLLETMPQGLVATPGSGVTENLVDKALKLGIKVLRIGA